MSLYQRGKIWHYNFVLNGERYRASTKTDNKVDARKVMEKARKSALLGESVKSVPSLEDVADQWFASRKAGTKSEKTTAYRVKTMLRHMDGSIPITEISSSVIENAIIARSYDITRQKKMPTPSTLNRDMIDTTLRPILKYAKKPMGFAVQDIEWTSLRRTEPPARDREFTPKEIAQWRQNLPEWHRPVFDFVSFYGVRMKEAFFSPDALDPVGKIHLRDRKNKSFVLDVLPEHARELNARASRAREAGLTTVWFRDKGGKLEAIHWRAFQSASQLALKRAGIANARPVHDLRHHAAQGAYNASGDLSLVQALLGHERIQSTQRYAKPKSEQILKMLRHVRRHRAKQTT